MKYSPIPTRQESNVFLLSGGLDSVNDPLQLAKGKFIACTNIDLTDT